MAVSFQVLFMFILFEEVSHVDEKTADWHLEGLKVRDDSHWMDQERWNIT